MPSIIGSFGGEPNAYYLIDNNIATSYAWATDCI